VIVVPQRLANLLDALHQAVVGDHGAGPHRLHQFVLGDHATGVSGQELQHAHRLWPQPYYGLCCVAQQCLREVQLEAQQGNRVVRGLDAAARCIPGRQHLVVPRQKHMWPSEDPQGFGEVAMEFLRDK
jgi:hypothetical protein